MNRQFTRLCILIGSLSFAGPQLVGQEIVHALCGTVSSIDTARKTITVFQDRGTPATFAVMSSSNTRISFDKKLASEVTAAKEFQKQGAYVILFYFGGDDNRTAVALKSLGAGPFSSTAGVVTKWDGHDNTVSVKGEDGVTHTFRVDAQTVGETYLGAVNGAKFEINKGEQVRVVSSTKDGTPTALFVREN